MSIIEELEMNIWHFDTNCKKTNFEVVNNKF